MQLMQDGKSEKAVKLLKGDNHQMQIIGEQKVVAEAKVGAPPARVAPRRLARAPRRKGLRSNLLPQ